jgi:RNA polymerase sigma factor (sigma-70 family)
MIAVHAVHAELPGFDPALALPPERVCPPELAGLMVGVAAGEQRALERFYRLTISRVFGLALRIVRCRATAEEVAEDVYVQIWYSAATYNAQRGSPLAWALTICRSRAIDRLRRADGAILDADPTERLDAILQRGPDLQDLLQATRDNIALHAAVARLGSEQRQVLALAFFRGLTHAEISQAAALPLGTVKSHIRRALATLREELGTA